MPLKKIEKESSQPRETLHKKQVRLLYVEDEDVNWEVTLLHLQERYFIDRAKNAAEAFALLREKTYHAILMDIQLSESELDGIGITKVLRGTYAGFAPESARGVPKTTIPILFMTAYSARYSKNELLAVGGDDLITKPIDFTLLGLSLSRCLLKNFK